MSTGQAVMGVPASSRKLRMLLDADLGFHGTDSNQGTHGWHPFPAKFPPQLPAHFIEGLPESGDTVLDPMLGSGTTLVEAARLGRHAIGCDIDPLARLIASAKLAPLPADHAMAAGMEILERAKGRLADDSGALAVERDRRFDAKTREFLNYWFSELVQGELLALLVEVEALADDVARRYLQVVFSSIIIAKSGGVSLARDLAHTRPHRVCDKPPRSAFAEFEKRLRNNQRFDVTPTGCHEVRDAPAEATGLPDASVDLVVTSPPYANNAIDYMRAHKFSLAWLGWPIGELTQIRRHYLGHDAASRPVDAASPAQLPGQCEGSLERLAAVDERKAQVLRRYFSEMHSVLAEIARVLKPGKAAVVVVGTSRLRGIDVETHKGLAALGVATGLDLAGIGTRELDRDKRMMPARWGKTRTSRIEERMHQEFVIGLIKP